MANPLERSTPRKASNGRGSNRATSAQLAAEHGAVLLRLDERSRKRQLRQAAVRQRFRIDARCMEHSGPGDQLRRGRQFFETGDLAKLLEPGGRDGNQPLRQVEMSEALAQNRLQAISGRKVEPVKDAA